LSVERVSDQDFRTLGIDQGASREEVKRAYREMAKRWHPDRFQGRTIREQQRAEEMFKEITAAYRRISGAWKGSKQAAEQDGKAPPGPPPESRDAKAGDSSASDNTAHPGYTAYTETPRKRKAADAFKRFSPRLGKLRHIKRYQAAALLLALFIAAASVIILHNPPMDQPRPSQRDGASPTVIVSEPKAAPAPEASANRESESAEPLSSAPPSLGPPRETPSPAADSYFTMGSIQAEVLRIQGIPTRVRGQVWIYGLSEVHFKDGRVVRFDNFDGNLRVRLIPSTAVQASPPEFFSLGSTMDEVLAAQGATPARVDARRWHYGFSEVRFKDNRVIGFDNFFGDLRIKMLPSPQYGQAKPGEYFTIGSNQNEVLAIQGTPSSVQGNLWFYQFSNVLFRDGKVQSIVDSGGSLRFRPPEDTAKR
jgi:hypothetical protein